MPCEDCIRWTPGTVIPFSNPEMFATYGQCKPVFGLLPFWAARWERDMQTNTLPVEGLGCPALRLKEDA